jgi:hypothetical protein
MSLDVYLKQKCAVPENGSTETERIFIREDGQTKQISREEWDARFPGHEPATVMLPDDDDTVYHGNITHNLGRMAHEAGLYDILWRPDENDLLKAYQLIAGLEAGLERLLIDPDRFQRFNAENGWGTYDGLVRFTREYLAACNRYPNATVTVWR